MTILRLKPAEAGTPLRFDQLQSFFNWPRKYRMLPNLDNRPLQEIRIRNYQFDDLFVWSVVRNSELFYGWFLSP